MKRNLLFTFLVAGIFLMKPAIGQDVLANKIYRVTAYKTGSNHITSMSNYAEVVPPLSVFIPNAFTPNGDGINDTFGVKGEGIQNYTMRIFDRWGEIVFESSNPRQQWDGTYKGEAVQMDTYTYQLLASGIGSKTRTGSVTLVR